MDRAAKAAAISDLQESMNRATTVVVVQASGLSADETRTFRVKTRAGNVTLKVIKNTLAKRAIEGTKFAGIANFLKGQTALAFSSDAIAPAKVIAEFAKTNDKVKIVGGAMDGQILDAQSVKNLATLPSLPEIRASFLGLLQTPATRLAVLLKEPAGQLARVMAARGRQE
ncbi:MAG: 50S ribosomal protein L10 [Alphaproteobacteria bacterium]|nr:50S ribosomal protein L10 [Alphaproteobacteria bacterium]NDC56948.1 50S ribosomal protein L10 [Alphaproteobacteria bacterium]NDG04792.1 50S ribosomal protein L10 [Alphaproteobacteria bacterium]